MVHIYISNFGEKNGTNMQNPQMKCTFLQGNPLKNTQILIEKGGQVFGLSTVQKART